MQYNSAVSICSKFPASLSEATRGEPSIPAAGPLPRLLPSPPPWTSAGQSPRSAGGGGASPWRSSSPSPRCRPGSAAGGLGGAARRRLGGVPARRRWGWGACVRWCCLDGRCSLGLAGSGSPLLDLDGGVRAVAPVRRGVAVALLPLGAMVVQADAVFPARWSWRRWAAVCWWRTGATACSRRRRELPARFGGGVVMAWLGGRSWRAASVGHRRSVWRATALSWWRWRGCCPRRGGSDLSLFGSVSGPWCWGRRMAVPWSG